MPSSDALLKCFCIVRLCRNNFVRSVGATAESYRGTELRAGGPTMNNFAATNASSDVKQAGSAAVQATELSEKVNSGVHKSKSSRLLKPIKRRLSAFRDWTNDRRLRLRVYNDDFFKDIPPLYITRLNIDDNINLDTDEDRGYITPAVKKITQLGGVPVMEQMTNAHWDEFIPPARTPLKKATALSLIDQSRAHC